MNIIQFLKDRFHVDVMNDDNISIACPWCGKGNRHFTVSVKIPVFNCWKCGVKGNYSKLIAKIEGIPYREAERLAIKGDGFHRLSEPDIELKEIEMPKKGFWTKQAREYAFERGIGEVEIKDYGIYYCTSGREQGRIIFPVVMEGKRVGFQARALDNDTEIRYMSPKGASMKNFLWNYDSISGCVVWVVEGIIDGIAVASEGGAVVSTFGKSISEPQRKLLKEKTNHLILWFDPDTLIGIETLWYSLMNDFTVSLCPISDSDPAEWIKREKRLPTEFLSSSMGEFYQKVMENQLVKSSLFI